MREFVPPPPVLGSEEDPQIKFSERATVNKVSKSLLSANVIWIWNASFKHIFFNSKDVVILLPNILCYWVIFCRRLYPLFFLDVLKFNESVYMSLFSFSGFDAFNLKTDVFLISEKFLSISLFTSFPPILKFHLFKTSFRLVLDTEFIFLLNFSLFKICFSLFTYVLRYSLISFLSVILKSLYFCNHGFDF